jgi:hypothetical protein
MALKTLFLQVDSFHGLESVVGSCHPKPAGGVPRLFSHVAWQAAHWCLLAWKFGQRLKGRRLAQACCA